MPVQSACAIELRRKLVIFKSAHERSLLTIKTSGERPRMCTALKFLEWLAWCRDRHLEFRAVFDLEARDYRLWRSWNSEVLEYRFPVNFFAFSTLRWWMTRASCFREGWAVSKGRRKLFPRSIARHKGCTKPKSSSPSNRLWHGAKVSVFVLFYLVCRSDWHFKMHSFTSIQWSTIIFIYSIHVKRINLISI